MKGREGDVLLGDAITALSHPITTLDCQHRPDTHTTNTPDRLILSSTKHRERRVRHNPDRHRKKGEHSAIRRHKGIKAATSRTGGRENKKGSPPTGQAETNSLKRPKTLEGVEPHRARTASNSVVWQEPSPMLRCEAQRCGSDAIPPRGSQLAAMLVPRPRLPSHRVTRSGLEEGAHLHLTPCVSMKSRAKMIFHDSVEHTEQDAYTRRQGALSNSGHFDTHAMPHLHHQGHPPSRADASKTHRGTCCFQPGVAAALGAPRSKEAPPARIGNLVRRALTLCRSHELSVQGC